MKAMNEKNIRNQIYKCDICGNIVEILTAGRSSLVCCGYEMKLQNEKIEDAKAEKHVPILIDEGHSVKIVVGAVAHPMEEAHYIEWIEVINGDYVNRKHLKAGDKPEALFYVHKQPGLLVRAYCNIHGLWRGKAISMN